MIWTPLTLPDRKIQMLCINQCNLSLQAAKTMLDNVTADHHDLIYIDLYGNNLGDEVVDMFGQLLDRYDLLEFIGIGKNRLSNLVD